MKQLLCGAAIALAIGSLGNAATISIGKNTAGQPVILFDGEIGPGDATAVATMLVKQPGIAGIRLSSPGGQIGEAIEIARLVAVAKIPAFVTRGQVCASACAIIYICSPERHANVSARVGVHSAASVSGQEDSIAYVLDTYVARIIRACGAPPTVVTGLITTPALDMYWLTLEDAVAMNVHFWRDNTPVSAEALCALQPAARGCGQRAER
jgi:hypothetical protein